MILQLSARIKKGFSIWSCPTESIYHCSVHCHLVATAHHLVARNEQRGEQTFILLKMISEKLGLQLAYYYDCTAVLIILLKRAQNIWIQPRLL